MGDCPLQVFGDVDVVLDDLHAHSPLAHLDQQQTHIVKVLEVLYVVLVTEEVVLQGFGEHVVDVVYAPQVVVGQRNLSLVFLELRCLDVVL